MHLALFALVAPPVQTPVIFTLAADTYIDRRAADANAGREPLLIGGIDKSVLVQFPDLGLNYGAGRKVKSAKMTLAVGRPGTPELASVGRVLRPWGEGGDMATTATANPGGATWKSAISGRNGLGWDRDGALGASDAETVSGTSTGFANDVLTISGLEAAVQTMIDNPQENYGFRLSFANSVAFFSNDSLANGPHLVVEFEDATAKQGPDLRLVLCEKSAGADTWEATLVNTGDAPSPSQTLWITVPGRQAVEVKRDQALDAGGTARVTFELPQPVGPIPQQRRLVLRVSGGADANPSDNGLVLYPEALSVAVQGADAFEAQQAIADLNERVFPFSKFGAWPTGCTERLRLVTRGAAVTATLGEDLKRSIILAVSGLPQSLLRPYVSEPPLAGSVKAAIYNPDRGQVGLLPDTRDDVLVPRDLAIPERDTIAGGIGDVPMNEWGMLSRSEVTVINSQVGKPRGLPWDMTPTAVFIRVFTPDGPPPPGSVLEVYQLVGGAFGSQPVFSAPLERDGSALLPPRNGGSFGKANPFGDLNKDGSNGWLLAVVRLGESVSTTWISVMQLWDEYARGNQAAAFIELRAKPVFSPLDTTQNLALNAYVTDAKSRFPAQLSLLVDGKDETTLGLADEGDGYWIDLDLGRDRQIGQIQLVFSGSPWSRFRILTYKTAQSPGEAQVWAEETDSKSNQEASVSSTGHLTLAYSARSVRSRFIRIIPLTREPVKLAEVRVIPTKTSP